MTVAFLFLLLSALLLIGTPIGMALGLSAVATTMLFTSQPLGSVAQELAGSLRDEGLLAIPFLLLSAALLSTGGMVQRIVRFWIACCGQLLGGLAIATVPASMVFAALAGASPLAMAAIGSVVLAGMVRAGYRQGFAAGIIGSAAAMGALVPPSIVLVIYAVVTGVPPERMLLAAVGPAVAAGVSLVAAVSGLAWIRGLPRQPSTGLQDIRASGWGAAASLLPFAIVTGGVCSGLLTIGQATAAAAAYAFVLAVLIARDIGPLKRHPPFRPQGAETQTGAVRLVAGSAMVLANIVHGLLALPIAAFHRDVRGILVEVARTTAVLMFVYMNASLFAHVLEDQQSARGIASVVSGLDSRVLLVATGAVLLLIGQVVEPAALVMVAAPILAPIAVTAGLDPVQLGVVMVVSVEIAMMTPPAGINLAVIAGMTRTGHLAAIGATLPWLGLLLLFLAALIAVPGLATLVPDLAYGPESS